MDNCRKCNSDNARAYPLVTIRTMTVRGGKGTQKYQAMGEVFSVPLCDACIDAYIAQRSKPGYLKALRLPLMMLIVAVAVHFLGLPNLLPWAISALFGAFAVAIAVSECRRIRTESGQIPAGKGIFTREHMIEELAATLLPKKHEDANLTYILRSRVESEDALNGLSKEYGVSLKKLRSIRQYLLTTPEDKLNKPLENAAVPDVRKKRFSLKKRS